MKKEWKKDNVRKKQKRKKSSRHHNHHHLLAFFFLFLLPWLSFLSSFPLTDISLAAIALLSSTDEKKGWFSQVSFLGASSQEWQTNSFFQIFHLHKLSASFSLCLCFIVLGTVNVCLFVFMDRCLSACILSVGQSTLPSQYLRFPTLN